MCILFTYTNPSPSNEGYRLIIASNRDEYYKRPAKDVFLCPEHNIIGGRDLEPGREGGMWLGISLKQTADYNLRFAALLNVTGTERKKGAGGRGWIVTDYLKNVQKADDYIRHLQSQDDRCNAYNFVASEMSNEGSITFHHSNSPDSYNVFEGEQILGFGNSTLAAPLLKVTKGIEKFKGIMKAHPGLELKEELIQELLGLLKCNEQHLPDPELENRAPLIFSELSRTFVRIEPGNYGTRTHSVVLVDYNGNVEFIESTLVQPYDAQNPTWKTKKIDAHL